MKRCSLYEFIEERVDVNAQIGHIYIYTYRCNAIIESIELRKIRSRECSDKLARGCELDDSRIDGGYPLDCEFWISIVCASFLWIRADFLKYFFVPFFFFSFVLRGY